MENTAKRLHGKFNAQLKKQTRRIMIGYVGELTAEIILRYEQVVQEWWKDVPPSLRICEDPFSRDARHIVESENCERQLLLFACLHSTTMIIHAHLLRPRRLSNNVDAAGNELYSNIQQRILALCMDSCEVLIHTVKQLVDQSFVFACRSIRLYVS